MRAGRRYQRLGDCQGDVIALAVRSPVAVGELDHSVTQARDALGSRRKMLL